MKPNGAGVWLLGLLVLVVALWWAGGPGSRSPARLPVVVVPMGIDVRSGCFVQLLDPRVGDPARQGELEQALASCLQTQPDFALVTGNCTTGPQHIELFTALLGRLDQAGVPAFCLPGPLDAAQPGNFSEAQLASTAAVFVVRYGPLRLVGVNSTLFLPVAQSDAARTQYAQRVFNRACGKLEGSSSAVGVFFHPTSLRPGVWDPRFAEPWRKLQSARPSFLCLDGQPDDSLHYALLAESPAGGPPGLVLSAGSRSGPRPVWRLFRLDADRRGIAFEEYAADGRLLRNGEHYAFP